MPEVLTMPEPGIEKSKDVETAAKLLADLLDPAGPYRWDLPPERLKVGDADYEYFVCRTSVYLGLIHTLEYLVRKGVLPRAQEDVVSDALANIQAVNRKPGLKKPEDMQILREEFTKALFALLEVST